MKKALIYLLCSAFFIGSAVAQIKEKPGDTNPNPGGCVYLNGKKFCPKT